MSTKKQVNVQCLKCGLSEIKNGGIGCIALKDVNREETDCRFFKTAADLAEGQENAYNRLINEGRYDLIKQYELDARMSN